MFFSRKKRKKTIINNITKIVLLCVICLVSIVVLINKTSDKQEDKFLNHTNTDKNKNKKKEVAAVATNNKNDNKEEEATVSHTITTKRSGGFEGAIRNLGVWNCILDIDAPTVASDTIRVVTEVGMHRISQCRRAAELGYEAHCFEPSPASYGKIQNEKKSIKNKDTKERIHLYNLAASSTTNVTVDFHASGSTGDCVGGDAVDMWNMKKIN